MSDQPHLADGMLFVDVVAALTTAFHGIFDHPVALVVGLVPSSVECEQLRSWLHDRKAWPRLDAVIAPTGGLYDSQVRMSRPGGWFCVDRAAVTPDFMELRFFGDLRRVRPLFTGEAALYIGGMYHTLDDEDVEVSITVDRTTSWSVRSGIAEEAAPHPVLIARVSPLSAVCL